MRRDFVFNGKCRYRSRITKRDRIIAMLKDMGFSEEGDLYTKGTYSVYVHESVIEVRKGGYSIHCNIHISDIVLEAFVGSVRQDIGTIEGG